MASVRQRRNVRDAEGRSATPATIMLIDRFGKNDEIKQKSGDVQANTGQRPNIEGEHSVVFVCQHDSVFIEYEHPAVCLALCCYDC